MEAADGPRAAVLIIGNEVLSGQVEDANGPFLLKALRARGVDVIELRIVADSEPAIIDAVNTLRRRADRLFCTGGIGPTHDDVTVRAVAHAFGKPVVVHAEMAERVREVFGDASASAMRLAEVPEGADVLLDTRALVPVITVANVTLLPGVPSFVRACAEAAFGDLRGTPIVTREWRIEAHETSLAQDLAQVQDEYSELSIGSYPTFARGKVSVLIRIEGRDGSRVDAALAALRARLTPKRPPRRR